MQRPYNVRAISPRTCSSGTLFMCNSPNSTRPLKMHSVWTFLKDNGAKKHLRPRCTAWYTRCPHLGPHHVLELHQDLRCHNRLPARLRADCASDGRFPKSLRLLLPCSATLRSLRFCPASYQRTGGVSHHTFEVGGSARSGGLQRGRSGLPPAVVYGRARCPGKAGGARAGPGPALAQRS